MVKKIEKSFSELHNLAVDVAKNIHKSNIEHGISIDKYGDIRKFVGDAFGVGISIVTNTRITVHNHPSEYKVSNSFSDLDIYNFLVTEQLCEIIMCSYGYLYFLRRGSYKITSEATMPTRISKKAKEIYHSVREKVEKEYPKYPENAEKTLKRATKEMEELLWSEYHKELKEYLTSKGLSYGRVKI